MIGLFYLSFISHSLYESPALAHHITWLPFQLSSQIFSVNSCLFFHLLLLAFCLYKFSMHYFVFPWFLLFFIQFCLNSFLFTVSLYSIVPLINDSAEVLTYHASCLLQSLQIPHNLSIPFLPFPH